LLKQNQYNSYKKTTPLVPMCK